MGKANTLLTAPNDWSTLSNGSVDGQPTGLHRYVGEQRFVFALLNVTDGAGNVVSYDLETKDGYYLGDYYSDASGNGLQACHAGDSPVARAFFGAGVRLGGSGSFVEVCGFDPSTKLNTIYQAFTVAFWMRPDQDYVGSGSGWAWSFGRRDLWRVGFDRAVGGPEIAVKDSGTAQWRSASAPLPLYAGRWYHIAAVLANGQDGQFHWSNLSLYLNGNRVAYASFGSGTSVPSGSTYLYLGWDEVSGTSAGRFKGIIDEFRLYSTSLSRDGVRGLMWFLKGSNSILIPRSVLYDSLLFKQMTSPSGTDIMNGPLAGANVHANTNNLSSNLNSRVIQMVIDKNLTLADAYRLLALLWTNKTGNVTAFPFLATEEFYTLGFAWEVTKIVANTSVPNGGNFTASPPAPPPPNWWDTIWNTIAGAFAYIWNAVVAVFVFFANAVRWLANAFIGLTIGLTTGNWDYFEKNVVEPLKKAFDAFVQWLMNVIETGIKLFLNPLLDWVKSLLDGFKASLASLAIMAKAGGPTQSDPGTRGVAVHPLGDGRSSDSLGRFLAGRLVELMYRSPLAIAILALILAASAAEKLAFASSAGLISVLSFGTQLIAGTIITFLVVEVITAVFPGTPLDGLIPNWFDGAVDLGFTVANFALWYWVQSRAGAGSAAGLEFETIEGILWSTLMSLVLVIASRPVELIVQRAGPYFIPLAMLVFFDAIALTLNAKASIIVKKSMYRPLYPLLYPASIAIWLVSLGSSVTAVTRHVIMIAQLFGRP